MTLLVGTSGDIRQDKTPDAQVFRVLHANPRTVLAKQLPEPLLGNFRIPRQTAVGSREAYRRIPPAFLRQPHEDQRYPRRQMFRGRLTHIVLIDRCHAATGGVRAVPRAPFGISTEQFNDVGNRPIRTQGTPLRVRSGNRGLAHRSMVPRPAADILAGCTAHSPPNCHVPTPITGTLRPVLPR